MKLAAVWALFTFLQCARGTPFFGVSVQGGFQTDADLAESARAIGLAVESSKQSMVTFTTKLPLSSVSHNVTASAVLQLYDIIVNRVVAFTNRISWAAVNTTDAPTEVFQKLSEIYADSVTAVTQETNTAITSITSYAPEYGAQIGKSRDSIVLILADIDRSLALFKRTIDTFSSPVTAKSIFEKLTKTQMTAIVGALDALNNEVAVVVGKLQETATVLTDSDALMSTYIGQLSQAFSNVDSSLSSMYTALTGQSVDFRRQFRASESTIAADVRAFNAKINYFKESVITPYAPNIVEVTSLFSFQFRGTYNILRPNIEEQLDHLIDIATDDVLGESQNILFTVYRVVDGAIRRIPKAPARGKSCAISSISPYVQYLSSNLASSMNGCFSSMSGQVEAVFRGQQRSIDALVKDREGYFKMWNDALSGITNTSDASARNIAVVKLTARTNDELKEVLQPSQASSFSMYAQLVSNLNAVLNRGKLCLALKGAELSANLVATAIEFNTCLDS